VPTAKFAEVPQGAIPAGTNLPPTSTPGATGTGRAPSIREIDRGGFERINVGDSLMVVVGDTPQPVQPIEEHVSESGRITLLHNESFQAAGKKRTDLEKEIHDRYVPDYYKFITITVKILNRFYFVDGEVKAPNRYIYEGNMTVLKAITSAGGFTDFASKRKVRVIRSDKRKETENCIKALDDPKLDLEIFPGDTVHVPRKIF
jgi:polysaccharide export outer membrane protein